jgi:hypothetical protein
MHARRLGAYAKPMITDLDSPFVGHKTNRGFIRIKTYVTPFRSPWGWSIPELIGF